MPNAIAIEFKNISKKFGAVDALKDCNFAVTEGSIHGIVGENGAGKSTAMKILFGMYPATSGQVLVGGNTVRFASPIDAMDFGIGMVHQHFMLAEPLTVLENILLFWKSNNTKNTFSTLPKKEARIALESLAARYGLSVSLDSKVEDLSTGEQQRVEILKVLSQDPRILILDEPTAVLTPQETQSLFANLKKLKEDGKTILIITHKLKEIKQLTDRLTIFRAGKTIGTYSTQEKSIDEIAELMVGRKLHSAPPRETTIDSTKVQIDLSSSQWPLQVHSKEIVGIAGIEGNGQKELIEWIYNHHLRRTDIKTALLHFGAFPEDRLKYGVLPSRPLYENFILGHHWERIYRSSIEFLSAFFDQKKILQETQKALDIFDVRPRDPLASLGSLSGGNQQKLVVARELMNDPDFILAAQPTRGVDIGAIEFIHNQIRQSRDKGAGVLLVSSELEELLQLSDRILVLYKNKIVLEIARHQFDELAIGKAMGGGL